ncbi:MAG: hypothetical protein R6W96_08945 [Clostridia bacterium]
MRPLFRTVGNTKGQATLEACIGVLVLVYLASLFLFLTGYLDALYFVKEKTLRKAMDISLENHVMDIRTYYGGRIISREEESHHRIREVISYVKQDSQNIAVETVYLYQGILGNIRTCVSSSVPGWTGDGSGRGEQSVWALSSMERGLEIQRVFGGNLPRYFPLIDIYDAATGTATVVVSLDTTLKSYLEKGGISRRINALADAFHMFERGEKDDMVITSEDIMLKSILVILPVNPLSPEQLEELDRAVSYARDRGLSLTVKRYQESPG